VIKESKVEKRFDKPYTNEDLIRDTAELYSEPGVLDQALPTPERIEESLYVMNVPLRVKKLESYDGLPDLSIATIGSVGVDLFSAIREPVCLNNMGARAIIPTGIAIELPVGFEAQIRPRSGLAAKHGITVLNTPGTIDSDYRGEIGVILLNTSTKKFFVERGMKIAQMVIKPVVLPTIEYVDELSMTGRGAGGFGSTGT